MKRWAAERHVSVGAIASAQTVFELGRDWYATRLARDWRRATSAEAQAMFERSGLSGDFWAVE